jgi:hypoxanthine phosphoribosyltransferase
MQDDVGQILYSREVIEERVKELAAQVISVYREKPLTVAVVLRGGFIFAADLVRHLGQSCEIVFVRASSYGDGKRPQRPAKIELPSDVKWKGRHVLVVEDIVDTGRSMKSLVAAIAKKGAASVRVCAFLDKPARREVKLDVEFTGFVIEGSPFVVGYGLDFAGRHRNLPYIGVLKPPAKKKPARKR